VHFLLTRPFTIGDKITIGKTTATVRDLTLRYVVLVDESGRDVLRTYSSIAASAVVLYGTYQTKESRLKFRKPALPQGLFRALRDAATPALWKPVAFSAAAIAALAFFPMLIPAVKGTGVSWLATVLPYAKAGLVGFLASSISSSLTRAITRLGERYAWNPAVVTVAKLGATVLTWLVGGSFLLNALGISLAWILTTLSIGGALVSIAVTDYAISMLNAIIVFRLKPFAIGDENVTIGEHTGTVVDITWQNVVLKLDDDRHMLLPHSVVKDAEIKTPRKYGQSAKSK
jgi:small-conductance mechanosensitive channel